MKTVENIRQQFVVNGFRQAPDGKKREHSPTPKLSDGEQEAKIIATRLGTPPPSYANRTLRLPARHVAELELVPSVSHETVRQTLKKMAWNDAEFVANMEEVPEIYEKPYNAANPVVCMDEQPVRLIKETRQPIPAAENHPRRVDYEYERNGTACVLMFTEPLSGWREAVARCRRTKADWATETARIPEGRYADCGKITLVCDKLNTHTKGAFYEASEPERARDPVRRTDFCHTPKHGSWLSIAENELSAMTGQCISGRRIGDTDTLRQEIGAWSADVNNSQRGVEWHIKIADARFRLKSVYPKIKF